MKPIIGVTMFREKKTKKEYSLVSCNYIQSILNAGGLPVPMPINCNDDDLSDYINKIDGILFTGGDDISPLAFGESPMRQVIAIDTDRDEYELKLFEKAYACNMPILGICRGVQLINVARQGTLYQDIPEQVKDAHGHSPSDTPVNELYHTVDLVKGSKLHEIFGMEQLKVNSFHHQSAKDLGKNLKVTAVASDGVIEGIESDEKSFLVGVQWHPEDLASRYPIFLKLFAGFIDASAAYAAGKERG